MRAASQQYTIISKIASNSNKKKKSRAWLRQEDSNSNLGYIARFRLKNHGGGKQWRGVIRPFGRPR